MIRFHELAERALPVSRRWRAVAALAAILLALGAGSVIVVDRSSALPDDAVFQFGDRVATKQDLDSRVKALGVFYGIEKPDNAAKQDRFRRDTAKALAVSYILDHAAQERRIRIADKLARDRLATTIEQTGPTVNREHF